MKHLAVLLVALLAATWLAPPARSGGRAGVVYRFVEPPKFNSTEEARKWLDGQGQNGFVLRTDVVLVRDPGGTLRIVPADSVGKPDVTTHLLFQTGRL